MFLAYMLCAICKSASLQNCVCVLIMLIHLYTCIYSDLSLVRTRHKPFPLSLYGLINEICWNYTELFSKF